MKKYQCMNIPQVVNKLKELGVAIHNKESKERMKEFCKYVRNMKGSQNDSMDYTNNDDEDISIYLEYDRFDRFFYVGIEK